MESDDEAIKHHGDNLTGDGDGDDEQISIDLKKVTKKAEKLICVVNIYQAFSRKQDFGMIKNAYIRLVNEETGKELCRYDLTENYDGKTAMIMGELYRHNDEWKFVAIGEGTMDGSISSARRTCRCFHYARNRYRSAYIRNDWKKGCWLQPNPPSCFPFSDTPKHCRY